MIAQPGLTKAFKGFLIGACLLISCSESPWHRESLSAVRDNSLTEHDMSLLRQSLARLGGMTERPKLSYDDNTAGHINLGKRWAYTTDPATPSLLVEPLNKPFTAVKGADEIADSFLGDRYMGQKLDMAAHLCGGRNLRGDDTTPPRPADIKVLESLPDELRTPLTEFLKSATLADVSCRAAFKELKPDDMREIAKAYARFILGEEAVTKEKKLMDRLGLKDLKGPNTMGLTRKRIQSADRAELARALMIFFEACERLADHIGKISPAILDQAVALDKRIELATSLGVIVLGGRGATLHPGPETHVLLAIDFGGNDSYKGAYGTGDGMSGSFLGAVIDMTGDDLYLSNQSFALGAGLFGIGLLFDLGGDDRYEAEHFSIGCGLGGWGVLVDHEGNDWYRGRTNVQGAGIFGSGLLLDSSGTDRYIAEMSAQGYGFTGGVGILADRRGNDRYQTGGRYTDGGAEYPETDFRYVGFSQGFGFGWRPDAAGGIGSLLDGGGDDVYDSIGAGFVQGCSYWFSYGLLYDAGGNDIYDANYYSQGAGIHFSTGVLIDRAGNDRYKLAGGGGQAWGHDYGVAFLIDRGGDDRYTISHLLVDGGFSIGAGQGGANMKGIALLVDCVGDDDYRTGPDWTYTDATAMYQISTDKKANPKITDEEIKTLVDRRRGIGILLDKSGHDRYSSDGKSIGSDGASWKRMFACMVADMK